MGGDAGRPWPWKYSPEALELGFPGWNPFPMAQPPPLPLRTRKSRPDAGSPEALLPENLPRLRRGGWDWLSAPGGLLLGCLCAPERCLGSTVLPDAGPESSGRRRARVAPVPVRGPCGAMNGTANPLLDREEHCLRLGESFEKRPRASFHTIRYDFKPASIDTSCEGELQVGKGDEVTITLPHIPVSSFHCF